MNPTGETTPSPAKPNIAKRFFSKAGDALGVKVVPSIMTVPDTQKPQFPVPPAFENAFKTAPEGTLDPTIPAPASVSEAAPSSIIAPEPAIVPVTAAPLNQPTTTSEPAILEPSQAQEVPAAQVEASSLPPITPRPPLTREDFPPSEVPPTPLSPVIRPESPVGSSSEVSTESSVPSMDFGHDKSTTQEEEPKNPALAQVFQINRDKYIKRDGNVIHLDMEKLQKDADAILEDPEKRQGFIDSTPALQPYAAELQAAGLPVDADAVSAGLRVIANQPNQENKAA